MQNLKNKRINRCLLCGQRKLRNIFSLGNLYISNFVNKKEINQGLRAPLSLMYCYKCTLIQLSHIAPQELMYKKFYWYKSGINKTMRDELKDLYLATLKKIKLKNDDVILDIGANDGTLLKYYKKKGFITIGCEPAKNLKELNKNCKFIINDFWSKKLDKILSKNNLKKPKIITAIGMFYDLEFPNEFIKDNTDSLHEDGIFVAQLMCLNSMVKKNDLGNMSRAY